MKRNPFFQQQNNLQQPRQLHQSPTPLHVLASWKLIVKQLNTIVYGLFCFYPWYQKNIIINYEYCKPTMSSLLFSHSFACSWRVRENFYSGRWSCKSTKQQWVLLLLLQVPLYLSSIWYRNWATFPADLICALLTALGINPLRPTKVGDWGYKTQHGARMCSGQSESRRMAGVSLRKIGKCFGFCLGLGDYLTAIARSW